MVRASINPYQANNILSVSINLSPDRETPADQDIDWSIAELPLITGSEARDGDATWTYHGHARQPEGTLALSLTLRGPELWLDPRGRSPIFENDVYHFVLLDLQRQLAVRLEDNHPIPPGLAAADRRTNDRPRFVLFGNFVQDSARQCVVPDMNAMLRSRPSPLMDDCCRDRSGLLVSSVIVAFVQGDLKPCDPLFHKAAHEKS